MGFKGFNLILRLWDHDFWTPCSIFLVWTNFGGNLRMLILRVFLKSVLRVLTSFRDFEILIFEILVPFYISGQIFVKNEPI